MHSDLSAVGELEGLLVNGRCLSLVPSKHGVLAAPRRHDDRLHDRLLYTRNAEGWTMTVLQLQALEPVQVSLTLVSEFSQA